MLLELWRQGNLLARQDIDDPVRGPGPFGRMVRVSEIPGQGFR
jgi:hypothetical protein